MSRADSYYEGYSAGVGKPKVSNGNYRVTPTETAADDTIRLRLCGGFAVMT